MSTRLDVFNDALEWLGEPPTTDPDENTEWVTRIRNAYDREVRKMFELHTWNFAMAKVQLAAVGGTPDGWNYGFGKPAGCKRIVKVAGSENPNASPIAYLDFGGRILSDHETTWLDYVDGTVIDEPGRWPEVFAGALAARLAFKVCPITGTGTDKREMLERTQRRLMAEARLWDAQQNGAWTIPPGEYENARAGFSRRYMR